MKCIVTGGAGFIGSNLTDRLIDGGHQVTIFDDLSTGFEENINPKATFYKVDISNMDDYYPYYFNDVDVIFHLACLARVQPSIENPMEYHNANVNGTLNLLEMARKFNIKRFVFSSSSSVYGDAEQVPTTEECELNPMSPYALHKLIGEQYCKLFSELYGIETVSLRYFNVYGERQPTEGAYCLVMGVFAQQLLNGELMTINGDGEQRRDFTYVGDVVDANIKCATIKMKWDGDIINIGAGDNRSVNQIADLLGGDSSRVHRDPVVEPRVTKADNGKAQFLLNWKSTTTLEEWIPKWKEQIGL